MKKMAIVGLMGALCCAAVAAKPNGPQPGPNPGPKVEKRAPGKAKPKLVSERMRRIEERGPKMTPRERRLLEAIEEIDSLHELLPLVPQVQASPNPELRQAMVDALEEQGPRAASSLVLFLADPDEDVADDAFTAWTTILEDMKPRRRVAAILAASQILQPPAQTVVVPAVQQQVVTPVQQPVVQPATAPVVTP